MAEKSSLSRLQSNDQLMMPNSESSHSTDNGLHGTDGMLKIGRFKFRGKTDNLPQFVTVRIISKHECTDISSTETGGSPLLLYL